MKPKIDLKTVQKGCNACGGPIAPIYYRIEVEQGVIDLQSVNVSAGIAMMTGSAQVAEALGGADAEVEVMNRGGIFLCPKCMNSNPEFMMILFSEVNNND